VTFAYMPAKRELYNLDTGELDACALRSDDVLAECENVVLVPVPLMEVVPVAVSMKDIPIADWADLKPYRVGVLRGDLSTLAAMEKFGVSISFFNRVDLALQMLAKERLDAVIVDKTIGKAVAKRMKRDIYCSKPLATVRCYHAVNKKHRDLVPKLEAAFLEMYKENFIQTAMGAFGCMLPASLR